MMNFMSWEKNLAVSLPTKANLVQMEKFAFTKKQNKKQNKQNKTSH